MPVGVLLILVVELEFERIERIWEYVSQPIVRGSG